MFRSRLECVLTRYDRSAEKNDDVLTVVSYSHQANTNRQTVLEEKD